MRASPISSLEEFWAWTPDSRPSDSASRSSIPLDSKVEPTPGPKLLVCHDLQGGYGDDSLLSGGSDPNQFAIYAWHLIDAFIYFSHHLITIPTPGWSDAAHRHGVPVLGTFITEWEPGRGVCDCLFADKVSAGRAAAQLATIAAYFRFEGWLINIENSMDVDHLGNLLHFLRELRRLMRNATPFSQVIWYDAVTTEGKLSWQNSLTELNRPFFEACDGLFVNYVWKQSTPAACAAVAGNRRQDVYMGIDVFGRNTFGGGGFNSAAALDAANSAGLSCALFAPGWLWETADPGTQWRQRSTRFWHLLCQAVRRWRPRLRPTVLHLPFGSSFNQGCGLAAYQQGQLASEAPWFDLRRQDMQPQFQDAVTARVVLHTAGTGAVRVQLTWLQASVLLAEAFEGGSVLRISGRLAPGDVVELAVFGADLAAPAGGIKATATACMPLPGCCLGFRLAQQPALAAGEGRVPHGADPHATWLRKAPWASSCALTKDGDRAPSTGPQGWEVMRGSAECTAARIAGFTVCCWTERPDGMFHVDIGELRFEA